MSLESSEPIHEWFSLTYASYLVLRRSVLQSAPVDVQARLVSVLRELAELFDEEAMDANFVVQVRSESSGKFVDDPYADYERGRRRIPIRRAAAKTEGEK
jgi:hypothetical protein